jgi:hypothetical protein
MVLFLIGLVVGVCVESLGLLLWSLCVVAKRADEQAERLTATSSVEADARKPEQVLIVPGDRSVN